MRRAALRGAQGRPLSLASARGSVGSTCTSVRSAARLGAVNFAPSVLATRGRHAGMATQADEGNNDKEGSALPEGVIWDSDHAWQKKKMNTPSFSPDQVVTRAQVKEIIANNAAGVLDLRTVGECKLEPGLPTAVNIPADDLMRTIVLDDAKWRARFGFAKPQKDARLVIYTSPEDLSKSAEVLSFLADNGFASVQVLLGGAREWNKYENPNF